MADLEFEDHYEQKKFVQKMSSEARSTNKMAEFLVRHGWAKDLKQADYILIAIIVILAIIALYLFHSGVTTPPINGI